MREWVRNTMLLGVLLVGAGGGVLACGGFGTHLQDYDLQKTLDGADVKALAVNSRDVNVQIVPGDGDKITAHFYGRGKANSYELVTRSSEGEATFEIDRPDTINNWGWFGNRIELHLDVTVPRKMYDRLRLNSSSGDVELRDLQAKQFAVETSSGDLNAEKTEGDQLVFKTSSGDLTTQGMQAAKSVELRTSSGSIKSNDLKAATVDAESSSGDLALRDVIGVVRATTSSGKMELQSVDSANGTIEAHSSSGDVAIRDTKAARFTVETSSGKAELTGVAGDVQARTMSGDIQLGLKELGKNVDLHTSSGSAQVSLPSSASFDLRFKTNSGDLKNDFPMEYQTDTKNDKQGHVGSGGATVNFDSSSGDLSLRKG
jgi:lia operon protein LiaG